MAGKCVYYYRTRHRERLGKVEYQSLTIVERGILETVGNLAASTNNAGSLEVNQRKLTRRGLVEWLCATVKGCGESTTKAAVASLIDTGFLSEKRGVVIAAEWLKDQIEAPSADAERQRRHRERLAAAGGGQPGDEEDGAGGPGGPPPAPPSSSDSGPDSGAGSERDMSHQGGVTCHDSQSQSQNQSQKSESAYASIPTGGAGGGPPGVGAGDIYTPGVDLVALAEQITRSRGVHDRNTWLKALAQIGEQEFRTCLSELRQQAVRGGIRVPLPAYFVGILKRHGAIFARVAERRR